MSGLNIMISFFDDYNFHGCLASFLMNTMTGTLFIFFLSNKVITSKPLIDIKSGITDENGSWKTVISRSIMIARSSILWFILCCLPFVIYQMARNDLFEQIGLLALFIIVTGALAAVSILVLSTILLLYYQKMYSVLISLSGIILTSYITFIAQTELNLLFLFAVIIVIACFSSSLLLFKNRLKY